MRKIVFSILCFLLAQVLTVSTVAQENESDTWVSHMMDAMSLDQKIGQLFMIRAHSDLGPDHIKEIERQIKEYHVGGLCFFQGTPTKQAELTNRYQRLSKIPLMVSIDGEWGLGMRYKKDAISFPKQLTLGAIKDNTLVYDMGKVIASQLKRVGIQVNFAPVVDVNNNPSNPVIHNRSFGEDVHNVATKSYAYMKGMQDNGILACAKHFPGHGDTDVDSHYDLPLLTHSRKRLDSLELMPFRVMTQLGIKSMMSAHLAIPTLDDRPNRPGSLSKAIVNDILRDEMNFEGLVFTDALEMKGVANHFEPGIMEVEALKAGNDILLLPLDIEKAINAIKKEIVEGGLDVTVIDEKVERILRAKQFLNLTSTPRISNISKIDKDINNRTAIALKTKLYEKAVTLVADENNQIPFEKVSDNNVASLSLGTNSLSDFQLTLKKFGLQKNYYASSTLTSTKKDEIIKKLKTIDKVIISIHDMNIYKKKEFGISDNMFELIYKLNAEKDITLVIFGSPYALSYFENFKTIIMSYEEDPIMQDVTAQAMMGVTDIEGVLPVTAHTQFTSGMGLLRKMNYRLGYSLPEYVQVNSDSLEEIDQIVDEMIRTNAAPGCQILAARNGRIFYQKSFGYHTNKKENPVKPEDIYDVASVTKILATTISLMKLYDEEELNLYEPIKKYLPNLDTTEIGSLIIEDILAHHSGLPGWIPFYKHTLKIDSNDLKKIERNPDYYRTTLTDNYSIKVLENLYLRDDWRDSIFNRIYNIELRDSRKYEYSDLGFYLFQKLIEEKRKESLDQYTYKNFYEPMGLSKTAFNPWKTCNLNNIPPSEDDNYFRQEIVQGYVHDMGAAMLGGVCGHAGLFSNSKDLAELMQMLLNGGMYAGKNYISPRTVNKFTKRYYKSTRRGLGFDMKELDEDKSLNIAEEASSKAFGHLGFTGISVYADPKYDLIFVFLSNRTFPTMNNKKFSKNNYRPRIQSVFYQAMMKTNS